MSVVKTLDSDPARVTPSSRAWAEGVLSAAGSGAIRVEAGRVVMNDDI
jgi:hypothetical protein